MWWKKTLSEHPDFDFDELCPGGLFYLLSESAAWMQVM
jgi:hypothetical protein